jgi:hypothetical protein
MKKISILLCIAVICVAACTKTQIVIFPPYPGDDTTKGADTTIIPQPVDTPTVTIATLVYKGLRYHLYQVYMKPDRDTSYADSIIVTLKVRGIDTSVYFKSGDGTIDSFKGLKNYYSYYGGSVRGGSYKVFDDSLVNYWWTGANLAGSSHYFWGKK